MVTCPTTFARFIRQQPILVGIVFAVYGLLWGTGQTVDITVVIIYTFLLGNTTLWAMDWLRPLFAARKFPYDWLTPLFVLIALTPFTVTVATLAVYWVVAKPGSPFWPYAVNSWKFPSLVTVIVGVIYLFYAKSKERLERRNLELQQAVQLGHAQRELQDKELARARDIQQALLPQAVPQIPGFEVAALWEPAHVVGGDYFDVIKLSETCLAVCIADVVGKSVSAALLMANVQATVRAFASETASPQWLCTRVNGVLANNIARDKFVTFFYGVLDSRQHTFTYTNAGHLPPIVFHETGKVKRLDIGGAVLGVFPDWKYQEDTLQLTPGDCLLLFTDGIIEAATPEGDEFGEERLISAVRSDGTHRPAQLTVHLLNQAKQFCNSSMADDATLMVIAVENAKSIFAQ
jgi:sigma-B regulation protein RsbU (phosphoserine phosphatase)